MGSHTSPPAGAPKAAEITSVLDSIRRVVRVLRVSSRAVEKQFGLSGAQLFVLHALAHGPALSLNELAERTRTHQSSVSVVVQRLAERGLVARTPVPGDARRTSLSLTPAALRLLRDTPDAPSERLIAALERMKPGRRSRLAKALAELVGDLGAEEEPATMLFEDDSQEATPQARPRPRDKRAGAGRGESAGVRKARSRAAAGRSPAAGHRHDGP